MLLFYILQKYYRNETSTCFEGLCHPSLQGPKLDVASISFASQILVPAMLLSYSL
jgi:hypothetical protein